MRQSAESYLYYVSIERRIDRCQPDRVCDRNYDDHCGVRNVHQRIDDRHQKIRKDCDTADSERERTHPLALVSLIPPVGEVGDEQSNDCRDGGDDGGDRRE